MAHNSFGVSMWKPATHLKLERIVGGPGKVGLSF
jgi:hypothetical protein